MLKIHLGVQEHQSRTLGSSVARGDVVMVAVRTLCSPLCILSERKWKRGYFEKKCGSSIFFKEWREWSSQLKNREREIGSGSARVFFS